MTVELRDNKLYAEAQTGNKQWVAVITDTHPKYSYDRNFAAYQKPKTSNRDSGTATVEDGTVIERVRYTHSGKTRKDSFYQLVNGEAHQIDEADVEAALDGEIVPDIEPETHECDECGDEFGSEHGLAVHQGIKHSDDGIGEVEDEEASATANTENNSRVMAADGGRTYGYQYEHKGKTVHLGVRLAEVNGGSFGRVHWKISDSMGENGIYDMKAGGAVLVLDVNGEDTAHFGGEHVDTVPLPRDIAESLDADLRALNDDADPEPMTDGGQEIREWRGDVQFSDDRVRHYSADGYLYAYREGNEHVVVSRGRDRGDNWTKRVPAERRRVVPGQKLWTVPDNWEHRATSKRDTIAYGLYRIPETGHWVKLSHSTNDHLVDCWYQVKAVGDLDVSPVGDLGSRHEVRTLASEFTVEEDAEALRDVADNWAAVEEDLRETVEWVATEGLDELGGGDQQVPVDSDWQVEFHQDRVFRPGEALKREMDLSEYEIPLSVILDELREAGLLPSYYAFELSLDSSAVGMEYYTRALEEAGCSSPETLDYYWVEIAGMTQTQRADERSVDQSTVSGNVSKAKGKLDS